MNENPGHGSDRLSMEWVEERLRRLATVEPSECLHNKLVADIPSATTTMPRIRRIWLWPPGMGWASVAAVVVLTASAVAWLGTPWMRRSSPVNDIDDRAGQARAADYNSLYPPDTNLCDMNSLR